MPINAQCPGCGQMLSVGDEFAGAQGKCPTCGTLVTFQSGAVAPAPPPAPPSYASADPGFPAYAPPAPVGPPRDNTELFTLLGLGGAAFSLLLIFLGTILRWGTVPDGGSVSGVHLGEGRMMFCLSLALAGLVGLSFLKRPLVPLSVVVAGAFGTFFLLVTLSTLRGAGAGIIIAFIGALGVIGTCIWTAIRLPLVLDAPVPAAQAAFIRAYGALLGTQTVAVVMGIVFWILHSI